MGLVHKGRQARWLGRSGKVGLSRSVISPPRFIISSFGFQQFERHIFKCTDSPAHLWLNVKFVVVAETVDQEHYQLETLEFNSRFQREWLIWFPADADNAGPFWAQLRRISVKSVSAKHFCPVISLYIISDKGCCQDSLWNVWEVIRGQWNLMVMATPGQFTGADTGWLRWAPSWQTCTDIILNQSYITTDPASENPEFKTIYNDVNTLVVSAPPRRMLLSYFNNLWLN